jgi:hypothetical protein
MEILLVYLGVAIVTLVIVWSILLGSEPQPMIVATGHEYYKMPDGAKTLISFDRDAVRWAVKSAEAGMRKPCSRTLFLDDTLKEALVSDLFARGGRRFG